jgi:hypothetical protein
MLSCYFCHASKADNVAKGNWTSPVLSSCPAGLTAENQPYIENIFYKWFYE